MQQQEEVSPEDQKAKADAHALLDRFHSICDMYNEGELDDYEFWGPVNKVHQKEMQQARKLIATLLEKSGNAEPAQQYMIFCARILLRLSHLIHNKKKETVAERFEHITAIRKKYNLTV